MSTTTWPERDGHPTDVLPEFVRGTAPGRQQIERHLAECPDCRAEVEILRALADPGIEGLTTGERELAFGELRRRQAIERSPLTAVWKVAAGIALLLGSVGVWQTVQSSAGAPQWSPAAAVEAWEDDLSELDPQLDEVMLALGYQSESNTELWEAFDEVDPGELVGPWEEEK
jgi:anti-sigma factor RsiW